MAKVTIVLEDTEDERISISVAHDPEPNALEPPTPVQVIAYNLLTDVRKMQADEYEDDDISDDDTEWEPT